MFSRNIPITNFLGILNAPLFPVSHIPYRLQTLHKALISPFIFQRLVHHNWNIFLDLFTFSIPPNPRAFPLFPALRIVPASPPPGTWLPGVEPGCRDPGIIRLRGGDRWDSKEIEKNKNVFCVNWEKNKRFWVRPTVERYRCIYGDLCRYDENKLWNEMSRVQFPVLEFFIVYKAHN